MSEVSAESRKRILALLRSLPHPGTLLRESFGAIMIGFSLRPVAVPQKLDSGSVRLRLMQGDKTFCDDEIFYLSLNSRQWREWAKERPGFAIRAEDVGKELNVVEEREKNFNRNLIHEFLDQVTAAIAIDPEYLSGIQNDDHYTCYFWDCAASVSGTSHSSDLASIKVRVSGLENCPAIELRSGGIYLKYWQLLQEKDKPGMRVLLKWHRTLISLVHVMKKDDVNIPIDLTELERVCFEEVNNACNVQSLQL